MNKISDKLKELNGGIKSSTNMYDSKKYTKVLKKAHWVTKDDFYKRDKNEKHKKITLNLDFSHPKLGKKIFLI